MISFILFLLGIALGIPLGRFFHLRPSRKEFFILGKYDRSAMRTYGQQYFKRLMSRE